MKIVELKISPDDIRIVASLEGNPLPAINSESFAPEYAKEKIIKVIRKTRKEIPIFKIWAENF